ncbi:peptidase S8/S53 domain-containing protein [Gymnopilus junonius]|uniref:Peptidase S8/S53 domain-containing protein n=1 Tax=Gymnopilus junonius TaxID=109634 RepID=A0A9P5NS61_GYMJU|nr:peptidase S8/S53 domain-containing protein [Gymnopilus junonius]
MHISWAFLASIFLSISSTTTTATPAKRFYDTHRYYALEHRPSDGASLKDVTNALGVEVVEQAGELKDVWLVRIPQPDLDEREDLDPVVTTFQNLQDKANSHLAVRSEEALHARRIVSSVSFLEPQIPRELVKRAPPPYIEIEERAPTRASADAVADRLGLKDPLFTEQWHLVNDDYPEHMMNTTPVWDMGITGKGVLTSFLDDGLDFETDDLKDAFDAEHSYDFNAHVPLPRPTGVRDHHGTRCAGQVAARRNEACGVGIAYDAKAAGVRILAGPISAVDEAAALNYGYHDVQIYSCSWGPRDNGQTMDGPGYLIRKAVMNGINDGRGGKGSIFVFASGNGGRNGDQCNFDGYTNSIYSVTVSSIDYKGLHPSYSEACAANLIVAYSSGSGNHIITTDRKNECSKRHGGTSAAAPNAVGVIALALEARPDLTWRDIQYLCIETARRVNPNDPDWEKTASGRYYSYKYGYGAIDAYAYVTAARTWKLVRPQAWLHTPPVIINNGTLVSLGHKKYRYSGGVRIGSDGIEQKMVVTKEMLDKANLDAGGLEHIDVRVWISHTRRGDVEVQLVSPHGVKSVLASTREYDEADTGFPGWRFMTVKHWGENPIGEWTLHVLDQDDPKESGAFLGWSMAFWGTAIDASKATKFVEPVVDNALPPADSPPRPVLNDPDMTKTTEYAKPTDHLPEDHGHAEGENTKVAFPTEKPSSSKPQQDTEKPGNGDWVDGVKGAASAQKWLFGGLVVVTVLFLGWVVYYWRKRTAAQKSAQYSSLAADDIGMEAVGGSQRVAGGAGTRRGTYDDPSTERLLPRNEAPRTGQRTGGVMPPSGARGLGFHSGFLDDDEPSAALTTGPPMYRDEPETPQRSAIASAAPAIHQERRGPSDGDEDDEDEEFESLGGSGSGSHIGSQERLT